MQFLREFGLAGILADDMGLGKTIQTLGHILLEKEAGRLTAPALVVAPTSLMGNWQEETARFAPGLRVLLLHGPERLGRFDQIAAHDLVLTTYALLPRDEAQLRAHRFHLLILEGGAGRRRAGRRPRGDPGRLAGDPGAARSALIVRSACFLQWNCSTGTGWLNR